MIYELRRYHTGAGRMQDMDEMCGKCVPPIFQRLGVPQAITAWHATSGPKLPAYWWLLAWPDLETRLRGWTAFYNDLEWLEVRRQFHLKSELTQKVPE
jgi:NIPSNAP